MTRFLRLLAALFALSVAVPAAAQTIIPGGGGSGSGSGPLTQSCGTVAITQPCLDLTATWATTGTYVGAIRLNVTDSGPANAASLMADLQLGGVSKFSVDKTGLATAAGGVVAPGGFFAGSALGSTSVTIGNTAGSVTMRSTGDLSWSTTTNASTGTRDLFLLRDAANTLALRNGTSAQTFNVYNTFTDSSNYERAQLDWSSVANSFTIGTASAGTGTARNLRLNSASSAITFAIAGTNEWQISSGNLLAVTDNTRDIGASGASRPRNVYIGTGLNIGSGDITGGNGMAVVWSAATKLKGTDDGAIRWTKNNNVLPTVATLPTCNAGAAGARAFVTDASATTFASTVAGSGTNDVPVYCDGDAAAWKIGALDLPAHLSPTNDNLPDGFVRAFG